MVGSCQLLHNLWHHRRTLTSPPMRTLGSPGCWNPRLPGLIKFIRLGRLRKWYLGDMDPKRIKTLSIFSTWASNIRENTSWTQTSIPWPETPGDPIPPQALSEQLGREITHSFASWLKIGSSIGVEGKRLEGTLGTSLSRNEVPRLPYYCARCSNPKRCRRKCPKAGWLRRDKV